jgi:plasmid stabilization system protein ParE
MNDLTFYAAASTEFEDAVAWYRARSVAAAQRFDAAVNSTIESIQRHPERFARWDDLHQFALVRKFPYYIAFRYSPGHVKIVAIQHAARDPNAWTDR